MGYNMGLLSKELKRSPGRQDGGGGAESATATQRDFATRLKNLAIDDGLDLQNRPVAECAFATTNIVDNRGSVNCLPVLRRTVIIADHEVVTNPQAPITVDDLGHEYIIGFSKVLPGCREKLSFLDYDSPDPTVLFGHIYIIDGDGNLSIRKRSARIGKAAVLRFSLKDVAGFPSDIFIRDITESPDGGWQANGFFMNAGENVRIKQDLLNIGQKKNGHEGVVFVGLDRIDGELWAYVTDVDLPAN